MAFRRVEFQNEFDNFTHSFTSGGPSAVAKFLIQEFQTKQQRDEFIGMSI